MKDNILAIALGAAAFLLLRPQLNKLGLNV